MIKLENYEVVGWEHAIRGMRNPMNSWEKSDSFQQDCDKMNCEDCMYHQKNDGLGLIPSRTYRVGPNDLDLMTRLRNAGTDHRKFMRMIAVYVDITAPLYWWKEFDTYKVGTTANSCSTTHKIGEKRFELSDFSCERLVYDENDELATYGEELDHITHYHYHNALTHTISALNSARDHYILAKTKPLKEEAKREGLVKMYWYQMIQLLPSSYNQKRTVMLNYEVLANVYKSRKNHKLDEWRELCKWIEGLPYSELITGGKDEIKETI